jgi:hypothetical protein
MMGDHALQEQAVELDAARGLESAHLRLRRHAGHVVMGPAIGAMTAVTTMAAAGAERVRRAASSA